MTLSCVKTGIYQHKLFSILKSKEDLIFKLRQLVDHFIRKSIMEKFCRKCAPETGSRPQFNSGKQLEM